MPLNGTAVDQPIEMGGMGSGYGSSSHKSSF
jgi:hypothetical protein